MTTSEPDTGRTTFEQAKICPKCGNPGEDRKTQVAPNMPYGTTLHFIYCKTPLCIWFDSPWMIQVNPDGSVPPERNHTFTPKEYVGFEGHDAEAASLMGQLRIMDQIKRTGQFDEIEGIDPENPFGTK